ncbi:glycosyltransferase family 2 protein [Sulfurihydrogenibium sp.]|uniref:glycosyltransferase family 2 protein n=1 Tax=Sulfurihydrogenibium sp. TaxID=2053621 RepID=UPI00262F1210|nr:glycosyltransferase family 2 protein [Sulfurihydrogenibium sp.]
MLNPKIYIILLNYNGWADTIECLESVLRNDYENYQVIVVDNNSPNNSMEYIKAWAEGKLDVWVNPNNPLRRLSFPPVKKPIPYVFYNRDEAEKGGNQAIEDSLKDKMPEDITTKYPLVFIQTGYNGGFAFGNNVAIKYALAKNDFDSVILLNNDTVIQKDTIKNLVKHRIELGEKAIYGGRIFYYSNPEKIWYDGGHFNEWLGRATHINMGKFENQIKENDKEKEVNFITFCYVLIPKCTLDKIGLLDESYFMYVEDLDYSYRVWKSGYKLYHIPTSKVWHKVGASSGEDEVSEFSAYWYHRNILLFRIKKLKSVKKIIALILSFILRVGLIFIISLKSFTLSKVILKGTLHSMLNGKLKNE